MTFGLVCLAIGFLGLAGGIFLIRNRQVVSAKCSVVAGAVVVVGARVPLLFGALVLLVTAGPGISIP